jgi:hypothetical protein
VCREREGFLHHEVDASHLVHELHPVRKHDSLASLDLVALENVSPFVLAVPAFQFDRLKDFFLLLRDLWVIGAAVPDLT